MDEKLCRICLCLEDEATKHVLIFETKESSEIAQKIFLISGVQVIESPHVPALICGTCVYDLWNAEKLRKRCLTADQYFRSVIPKKFYNQSQTKRENRNDSDSDSNLDENVLQPEIPEVKIEEFSDNDELGTQEEEAVGNLSFDNENGNSSPKEDILGEAPRKYKRRKKNLFCSRCFKSYTTLHRLKEHEYVTHTDIPDEAMFRCDLCKKKAKTKELIRGHILRAHTARPKDQFICGTCGKSTSTKRTLELHEKRHIEVDPSNYIPCPVCLKTFKNEMCVMAHRKLVHDRIRAVQCPHCPHVSSCKGSLDKHVKSIHLKLKDFVCSVCGVGFALISGLTRHFRIHTGERPFACRNEGCDRTYSSYKGRAQHKKVCPLRNQNQAT